MRTVFQLIRAEDGCRTGAIGLTREQLANRLWDGKEFLEGVSEDDLVVCVVEERESEGLHVSQAPIMSVASFVKHFFCGETANG